MAVCIFGDSVARGVVYDEIKKKYIYLRDCFVNRFADAVQAPVKNYAKFGCTVTKGEQLLSRHREELREYRYTALEFGGNDCDYDWDAVSLKPEKEHDPHVPLTVFRSCYAGLIEKVRQWGSIPVLLTLPPIDAERFFARISKERSAKNILEYLGDVQFIYRWHESYNLTVLELAQQYDAPFIDIRREFLARRDYKTLLCSDGMHPNQAGHALIDTAIKRAIPAFL